ncbi:dicarboxylic acid transporter PcaT [Camelimonas fluminis]|uniref:MFS family transporter n=1 Tax=Camelimonas fluminis TaxID=1576911 RepID=A0ABV7UJ09_9HYPH|nr:dicarboxylic acid transporter PcaT [Camelimonas fluminis]
MSHAATPLATGSDNSGMSDGKRIFAIFAASSGNLVEWFDFYAYAFTAVYFAHAFFPKSNPTVELMNAAAVFAIGFLMRPIGGWLFGMVADRYGRKRSMIIAVLMMCGGSLMIGLLPTYQSIGVLAPALLLLARMVQGLSVGGEYGTSATYMSEVAKAGRRGFFSSFQYVTLIGGQLLASLVVLILHATIDDEHMRAWGWRIPFFIGAIAALIALFLRRTLTETLSDDHAQRKEAGSLRALLAQHPKAFLLVLGLTAGGSLMFYTWSTYMQKYLINTTGLPAAATSVVMTSVLFIFMIAQPAFGALSDQIGRRTCIIIFGVLGILCTVPLLTQIATASTPFIAGALVLAGMLMISFYTSISGVVKAELFPPEVRALGVGFPYAVANALFGGTAEYVALALKNAGHESWFGWYVTAMAVLVLVVGLLMPDNRKEGYLRGEGIH